MAASYGVQVGRRARKRRLKLGLSQAQVAEDAGITVSQLCHLERGRSPRGPAPETIARLAKVLSTSLSELMPA